jgi:ubiquinone biosynthesis UbiH/UbiF/VisC/COQ6 family hydroxylase
MAPADGWVYSCFMLDVTIANAPTTAPAADVAIIGAGPAGLCCALKLADQGHRVCVVERQAESSIAEPAFDGREIALTHRSVQMLQSLGVWSHIDAQQISPLENAVVMTGRSPRQLRFDRPDGRCGALGYLVPNHLIRLAAHRQAAAHPRIGLIYDRRITDVRVSGSNVSVHLASHGAVQAQLLIAADSRFSDTRRSIGIAADMLDFGKSMLVCRMQHAVPHQRTAWEWFQGRSTLALLPLRGDTSSIVITVPAAEAARLLELEPPEFDRAVAAQFDHRLGAMHLCSSRHVYPLIATYSRQFATEGCALIGDAAVGMHPVTAHGFNLGLQSIEHLAVELEAAVAARLDIGSLSVLRRYEAAHHRAARPMYLATNAIVRLYTDDRPLHTLCRTVGLRLADRVSPIKRAIVASLMDRVALR